MSRTDWPVLLFVLCRTAAPPKWSQPLYQPTELPSQTRGGKGNQGKAIFVGKRCHYTHLTASQAVLKHLRELLDETEGEENDGQSEKCPFIVCVLSDCSPSQTPVIQTDNPLLEKGPSPHHSTPSNTHTTPSQVCTHSYFIVCDAVLPSHNFTYFPSAALPHSRNTQAIVPGSSCGLPLPHLTRATLHSLPEHQARRKPRERLREDTPSPVHPGKARPRRGKHRHGQKVQRERKRSEQEVPHYPRELSLEEKLEIAEAVDRQK